MQATSHYDLLAELHELLAGYLKHLPVEFCLSNQILSPTEIFMKNGLLPLFIYDKQPVIDKYVARLNQNEENKDSPFFAKLVFKEKQKDTYLGFVPELQHNLVLNNGYYIDIKPYYGLLEELGYAILNSSALASEGKVFHLDNIFEIMAKAIKNQTMNVIQEDKVLESNHV